MTNSFLSLATRKDEKRKKKKKRVESSLYVSKKVGRGQWYEEANKGGVGKAKGLTFTIYTCTVHLMLSHPSDSGSCAIVAAGEPVIL